jgi:SAM-dependent methyltransferase
MNGVAIQSRRVEQDVHGEAANFDQLAGIYRWLEWCTFGPILWRCRCAFLDSTRNSRNGLVIGDGDGRFTARLLELNRYVTVEALDASEAMLRQLLRRTAANRVRVHATVVDARDLPRFEQSFDLVVTHFFLDCLTTEEVESLAGEIGLRLRPGARWVISEFAVPKNRFGQLFARPLVSALYVAFGLLTGLKVRRLPCYRDAMERAGFVLMGERTWLNGLLVSELWEIESPAGV